MCLIIYKPNNEATFSDEHLKNSISRNTDGAGVMYVENGRIYTDKILGGVINSEDTIFDWCKAHLESKDTVAIHHRSTTHGADELVNLHPYCVLNKDEGDAIDLYVMHNGVIHGTKSTGKHSEFSDTWHYVNDSLKPMLKGRHDLIYLEEFRNHVQSFIGGNNKLLFMDNTGEVFIVNQDVGLWQPEGKCWISNTYSTSTIHIPKSNSLLSGYGNIGSSYNTAKDKRYTGSYGTPVVIDNNKTSNVITMEDKKKEMLSDSSKNSGSLSGIGKSKRVAYGNTNLATRLKTVEELFAEDMFYIESSPMEIVNKLLEDGFSLDKCRTLVSTLPEFTLASVIEEALERIYSRDYT